MLVILVEAGAWGVGHRSMIVVGAGLVPIGGLTLPWQVTTQGASIGWGRVFRVTVLSLRAGVVNVVSVASPLDGGLAWRRYHIFRK
jgi:hypothetical protein